MPHPVAGVWAAAVTPLDRDLNVDHRRFAEHVGRLLERGCHGVAVFGSTGEGNSFTVPERAEAVGRLASAGVPMDRILVGTGACAWPDVVTLSVVSADAGALGVLLHPPFYYKSATDDGLFAFLDRVAGDVERTVPGRPFRVVLYHFPRLVAVGYSEELVARLVEARPTVFTGIKDSSGDLERMIRLAGAHPVFSVLAGSEKYLLPLLAAGGAGCLTASANLTSPLARRVYDERDDDLQARLSQVRAELEAEPFVPGIKRRLAAETGDDGWLRARPPLAV